jgi:hypothetical protein
MIQNFMLSENEEFNKTLKMHPRYINSNFFIFASGIPKKHSIMKKLHGVLFAFAFFSTLVFFDSCASKDATTGILHITVIDTVGSAVPSLLTTISTSRQNQIDGIYSQSFYTDAGGYVTYIDLAPGYYWIGASGYKNSVAIQVYAGLDQFVYLVVTSPVSHPMK